VLDVSAYKSRFKRDDTPMRAASISSGDYISLVISSSGKKDIQRYAKDNHLTFAAGVRNLLWAGLQAEGGAK
jgi:hypothetical protein